MTVQEYIDDVARKFVAERTETAREHPGTLLAEYLGSYFLGIALLTRMGKRFGWPLKFGHWWLLVTVFGRDPGYPTNLIWRQSPPRRAADELGEAAARELATRLRKSFIAAGLAAPSPYPAGTSKVTGPPSPPRPRGGT